MTNAVKAGDLVRGDRVVFGDRTVWTVESTARALTDDGVLVYAVGEDSRGVKFSLRRRPAQYVNVEVTE